MKKQKLPSILAIDTSCDETSVAISHGNTILTNVVASQTQLHAPYGGVFPTIAKQAHQENIESTTAMALKRAQLNFEQIDAIAVTQGPGLAPALEIGIAKAKELANKHKKPLIAVNHIEGHILSVLAEAKKRKKITSKTNQTQPHKYTKNSNLKFKINNSQLSFPILSIVISGGHSQFILIEDIGKYKLIGQSIDDAAGECLDKVGRMLDLGYPAGPVIEQFAKLGDENKFKFPLPMTASNNYNLSFSGLKTYSRNLIAKLEKDRQLNKQATYDFCASLQKAVFRHICHKLNKILSNNFKLSASGKKTQIQKIYLGGGVAANSKLREMLRQTIKQSYLKSNDDIKKEVKGPLQLITPYSKKLCGDNAAMISIVAFYKFLKKEFVENFDQLDRKPRWPVTKIYTQC